MALFPTWGRGVCPRSIGLVGAAGLALASLGAGPLSRTPHVHPAEESPVPVSGYPLYLENLQNGSPVADHGSHFGVKAAVQDEGGGDDLIPGGAFLNVAHYLALTHGAGGAEQSHLAIEVGGGDGLATFGARAIAFEPWGWTEEASEGTIRARGLVLTAARNCFAEIATFQNGGEDPVTVTPVLRVKQDGDGMYEGLSSYIHPAIAYHPVRPGPNRGEWDLSRSYRGNWALLGPRIPDITRRYRSDFGLAPVADPGPFRLVLRGDSLTLAPGEERVLRIVFAESDDPDEIATSLEEGWRAAEGPPALVEREARRQWEEFFGGIEPIHSLGERDRRLGRLAAAALRMNVYAPRGAMAARCSVPSKAHFNFFWAWDTPFHAIAQKEWDTDLAWENMATLVAGQRADGRIPQQILDTLEPYETPAAPGNSQPPVQGWAAAQIARRDPDTAWMGLLAGSLARELEWWRALRDRNGNGLFEYANGLETGWDETPRYGCPPISNLCFMPAEPIEAIDLNPWLFSFLEGLAEIEERLGRSEVAASHREEAQRLARLVEERMWDEETGLYTDMKDAGGGVLEPIRVKTPASFWPLFVGLTRDEGRARRVVEEHLLDPAEFFGDPGADGGPRGPIPTVAYDDPTYDPLEDGFYWQGQVWLMPAYAALVALARYGYEEEAADLKERLLAMIDGADPGGIHETYDARTGEVGWGGRGVGEPSVFQFGWSTAFVLEMLLDRHQFDRFLMPGERRIEGYVGHVKRLGDGTDWLLVDGPRGDVPLTTVESLDGRELASSRAIRLVLSDPWGNAGEGVTIVRFLGHGREDVFRVRAGEDPQAIEIRSPSDGRGGGGGCAVGGPGRPDGSFVLVASLLALGLGPAFLGLRPAPRPGRTSTQRSKDPA